MSDLKIQPAIVSDVPLILSLIKELAAVEEFPFEVTVTAEDLKKNLFGKHPSAEALLVYAGDDLAGFAVFYQTFATTTGQPGLHLDDLYIRSEFQGRGIGRKVLAHLARIAKQRDCVRFEWWVLESNVRAKNFYEKIGARELEELEIYRLRENGIDELSNKLDR
ncbi:Ribosomal protein S18 acetylase RimI [Fodinibius roseus]|uniref:Ribosomal protein S18 acetylase RimI n=1 Tax=Fodinibius roseus TaxID=1194090 RepID=A0A1M4YUG0_9BACT|nr:GNAT family N-acetyltransferase [Fodinibius roseus]SHF08986.1 Ribosomal protein S18 acetylase RimI [Fodinibius roseus]